MGSKATDLIRRVTDRPVCRLVGVFALILLMSSSMEALAQEDVQARYGQLEEAAETAKERYRANPNGANLDIMNRSVDTFMRYERANRASLRKLSRGGAHKTLDTGGPDAFGYTFIDSDEPDGPVFNFIDITPAGPAAAGKTAGTLVASGDDTAGTVALGAPFDFYGTTYTTLAASTNGYLSTDPTDTGGDLSNDCPLPAVPSTGGGARIYPLHDDLFSDVYYEFFNTCPYQDAPLSASDGDLAITKTVDNTTPEIGEEITYTLEVSNMGNAFVDGVRVRDVLPDGVSFVSAAGDGTYDPATGIWRIGTVGVGCSIFEWSPTSHFGAGGLWRQEAILFNNGNILFQIGAGNFEQGSGSTTGIQNESATVGLTVACNTAGSIPDNYAVLIQPPTPSALGPVASLDITVMVNTDAPVTNTALITSGTPADPDPSNNEASVTINPVSADLSLTKVVTAFRVEGGVAHATYRVTVRNDGPNAASGVLVEDVGTPDMTLTGVSASQGTILTTNLNPAAVLWEADAIAVGASATLDISVTAPEGGNLLNVAEVVFADQVDPDSTPNDGEGDDFAATVAGFRPNPDFVSGVGPGGIIDRGGRRFSADLSITKTVDDETVAPGQDVVYTITVSNAGPQSTAGVEVTDELPECLDFVSADASQGTYDADTGVWDVNKLRLGASATIEITATVTDDCEGDVTNTASISGSNLPDPDDFFSFFDEEEEEDDSVAEATISVSAAAAKAQLLANYPNPFNPETVIPFELGAASKVSIRVYDLLGRLVQTLVDEDLGAGAYEVTFQGNQLSTGVYLVRMEAAGQVYTQRITLMK